MGGLYTKPLRVYILLGALAIWGILSGTQLPVSLFPKSGQVQIAANIPYGQLSSQQFFEIYGKDLEAGLQGLRADDEGVKELTASYRSTSVQYRLQFDWGTDPDTAKKEVENKVLSLFAGAEQSVRRGIGVYSWRENQGFFAVSFYSPMRSMDEIYKILDPLITPISSKVADAEELVLFNPNKKEVTITLLPEKLAQHGRTTSDIQNRIQESIMGFNGGTLKMGEREYQLDLPKTIQNKDDLGLIRISQDGQGPVFLKDVAKISMGLSQESRQKFKTSGVESLILFAQPTEGGNIKKMADQIMLELSKIESDWPRDIEYKVLVNPSEFINNSIMGVIKEVLLAAFLAVVVLFCFIGSFKNVITAAIEIPLSLFLAFILMRMTGMNLNLISLGGLALSAGMNVDASVVVLENIFRHFEGKHPNLPYQERVKILLEAVREVRLPIMASTLASLVVFTPLIFTNGLTNSLLGDLAKAVIFSHGLSAVVALVLVPTIRLQLMSKAPLMTAHSPFEKGITGLENFYARSLRKFLLSPKLQVSLILLVMITLPLMVKFIIPGLKKEVIGRPDSDWLIVGISSPLFNSSKQTESEVEVMEQSLLQKYGDKISYTFTQIHGEKSGMVMLRLKRKKDINDLMASVEENFKNTATKFYFTEQWNPSELRISDPPQVQLEITGGTPQKRTIMAQDLNNMLLEKGIYDKVRVTPTAEIQKGIMVRERESLKASQEVISKSEISHYLRVATNGMFVDRLYQDQQELPLYLRLEKGATDNLTQLNALPVGFEGRLIPLGALTQFSLEERLPDLYRVNQRDLVLLTGDLNKNKMNLAAEKKKEFTATLEKYKSQLQLKAKNLSQAENNPTLIEAIPDKELQEALQQLKWAISISVFLIFITMVLQLGDLIQSLLVLVSIPLGFIGVLISLWVFKSNLSLNSGLGTILLNGIAVANSIILVDFIQKLFLAGHGALESTLEASRTRLKPILMTSLTTVLGMLPVALGMGDGGKILRPLGIAVCGGLWVSMLLTLFLVPALQFQYLKRKEWKERKVGKEKNEKMENPEPTSHSLQPLPTMLSFNPINDPEMKL